MPAELYGPFGALAVFTFVVIGFIRGDIVPGWVYKAAVARGDKADAVAIQTADALAALAKAAANGVNGNGAKRG